MKDGKLYKVGVNKAAKLVGDKVHVYLFNMITSGYSVYDVVMIEDFKVKYKTYYDTICRNIEFDKKMMGDWNND